MGHHVELVPLTLGRDDVFMRLNEFFFFGYDKRMEGYAKAFNRPLDETTLEKVTLMLVDYARGLNASHFFNALNALNAVRRHVSRFWADYDIMLSPTTATTAPTHGRFHLNQETTIETFMSKVFATPIQFTVPHNIMGTPAISLPLALDSQGLPIGVQLAAAPAREHLLLQLARALEMAQPWGKRVPDFHVSR
jgi:amidase